MGTDPTASVLDPSEIVEVLDPDLSRLFNVEPYLIEPPTVTLTTKRNLHGQSRGHATASGHISVNPPGSGKTSRLVRAWLEHAERHLHQDEG